MQVIVVDDAYEKNGNEYLNSIGLTGEWIQCSYNNNIRNIFPGYLYVYDRINDRFLPRKIYNSWIYDENLKQWVSPIPEPSDGNSYYWDEDSLSWTISN